MKHEWLMSTEHPDICIWCHTVRSVDSDKEECSGIVGQQKEPLEDLGNELIKD